MNNYDENVQKIQSDLQKHGKVDTPEWISWRTGLSLPTIMDTLNTSLDKRDGRIRSNFSDGTLKIEGRS